MSYSIVVTALVVVGAVASLYFGTSFLFHLVSGRRTGTPVPSAFELVDYAGLQVMASVILALSILNIVRLGVQPPADLGVAITRILTTTLISAIVVIRAIRWRNQVTAARRRRGVSRRDVGSQGHS